MRFKTICFSALVLLGVFLIVGDEEEDGILQDAAASIQRPGEDQYAGDYTVYGEGRNKQAFEDSLDENGETDVVFADDADLIDDAQGFNPSPEILDFDTVETGPGDMNDDVSISDDTMPLRDQAGPDLLPPDAPPDAMLLPQ